MQDELVFLAEEPAEGDYTASAIGYSITVEAKTLEDLKDRIRFAVRRYFGEASAPRYVRLNVIREERICVSS